MVDRTSRWSSFGGSNVALYFASRFCSASAMTMMRAAIAWHVFDLTKSAFHLGLIGLVQFIPVLSLTLVGGAVADSYERRRVIMIAQLVPLTCAVVLFAVTVRGAESLPILYSLIACVAIAGAFENPARAAMLPSLVAREVF